MSDQESIQRNQRVGEARRDARADPFAHGDLPLRPTYLPEEGEGGRAEIWAILKGGLVALGVIGAIAWMLSR